MEGIAPSGYQAAMDAGLLEFSAGNYVEARARFLEAHQLWPNARTLRVLGYCEYELKNYVGSIDLLERALASAERALNAEQRRDSEQVLGRAQGLVGRVSFEVNPREASITIDGADAVLDAGNSLLLSVGAHAIEVHAAAHYPARRDVQVEGRGAQTVRIDLVPLPPPASAAQARHDDRWHKKWWVWTSAASVVTVALVTGLAVGLHDPGVRAPTGGSSNVVIDVPTAARP